MKKMFLFAIAIALVGCSPVVDDSPPLDDSPVVEIPAKEIPLRDIAIREYLLSQNEFSWTTEAGSARECVFADLNPARELFPLELWIYCSEFQNQNGEIAELSGASLPILLDYPNELSFFNLEQFAHEVPRDGSFFADDVRSIFSATAQKKIFDRAVVDELRAEIDRGRGER